jgi:hypothetical protein
MDLVYKTAEKKAACIVLRFSNQKVRIVFQFMNLLISDLHSSRKDTENRGASVARAPIFGLLTLTV